MIDDQTLEALGIAPKPLPCPFCGALPMIRVSRTHLPCASVTCITSGCPASGLTTLGQLMFDGYDAINNWNKRASKEAE